MNERFSSTGVNAGTAKRRQVLRIADAPATRPISAMYGNMIARQQHREVVAAVDTPAPTAATVALQPAGEQPDDDRRADDADER